jgi:hypothetical protein
MLTGIRVIAPSASLAIVSYARSTESEAKVALVVVDHQGKPEVGQSGKIR